MCGSDRTGFASSSRMSDSLASEGHPAFRGGGRQASRCEMSGGGGAPSLGGGGAPSVTSDQDQVDAFSVTSGGSMMYRGPGQGDQQAGGGDADRIYLTPAQGALQTQLKSKHAELHRRIALQQAELLR